MQIKRILLIPFILLATIVLLPIIAILFGGIFFVEVITSIFKWAFDENYSNAYLLDIIAEEEED